MLPTIAGGTRSWTPVLDDAVGSHGHGVLEVISKGLAESPTVWFCGGSLSSGAAGVATFFAYLSSYQEERQWVELAARWIRVAVTTGMPERTDTLFAGAAGVAWAVEHLGHSVLRNAPDPRVTVDEYLLGRVGTKGWEGQFDLVSGLVGIGVYALERLNYRSGVVMLERVVDRLGEIADQTSHGITWWTPSQNLTDSQRQRHPEGYCNLGLAHGVPAVIALLAQACSHSVAAPKARFLLDGAVDWLLGHRNSDKMVSCFPPIVPRRSGSVERTESRVAWCYGDLGVAAALYWAGRAVGQEQWQSESLTIARRAAVRPFDTSGVRDAGLCHGAAGVAHIFNRFYQATRERVFFDASRCWFWHALEFHRPGVGIGGFQSWDGPAPSSKSLWRDQPGLLGGTAGVGLALLAAMGTVEPRWDRMMLVSIPPG